ncbi:MAG TPA: hypothetical protein VD884_05715 [Ohtaekwangia sp.]|nr:hypothetical protein [Ohtaekwangia sp.]
MKPWPIISIVLAVVVILLLLFDNGPTIDSSVWKSRISELEDEIKEREQEYDVIAARIKSDSLESIESEKAYDLKVKDLNSTVAKLKANPVVIRVREETPEVDSLIVAQDSTITIKDQRIEILEYQYGKLAANVQGLTINFENRIRLHQEQFAASQAQVQVLEKENKKVKRQAKIAKILIPIVGLAGLILGGNL